MSMSILGEETHLQLGGWPPQMVRKTFTFEFNIFRLIAKVEYILGLLAKVRNFLCEDASRVKVNCMDALSSQPEILSCEALLDASACFAPHHVLMQLLACEQGKISPDFFVQLFEVWQCFFLCMWIQVQVCTHKMVGHDRTWTCTDSNPQRTRTRNVQIWGLMH